MYKGVKMDILLVISCFGSFSLGALATFFAYKHGISAGQKVDKEQPVVTQKAIKHEEPNKDEFMEGLQNIMNYDGNKK